MKEPETGQTSRDGGTDVNRDNHKLQARPRAARRLLAAALLGPLLAMALPQGADAGALERRQAKRIHDRIAGVPPSEAVLDLMEQDIVAGNPQAAAQRAMNNSAFYNVTLKNFAAPWTNEAQSVFVPLNDYTATVIGMIRDDVPFDQVLSGDIIYIGDSAQVPGLPPYSNTDNNHYQTLDDLDADLQQVLVQRPQSQVTGLPATATAGVLTTRAAAEAFFVAGTNRAMFRFTMMNHLCTDLEPLKDNSRSPDRVRQDVSRSPGGDSRIFMNSCVGCHAGMDPMVQAFAYYNYDETQGRLVYTPGQVQPKYLINADNFKYGYVTPNDNWDNYWRAGPNANLGWDAGLPGSGAGAKSLGVELAGSQAFAGCQVKKVFRAVCLRDPSDAADQTQVSSMVSSFIASNYSMKQVFADAAVYCMGD